VVRYIFGGNREQRKLEMTTPVLSSLSEGALSSRSMAFVMEGRFEEVTQVQIFLRSSYCK
jgi:hypothetical protein